MVSCCRWLGPRFQHAPYVRHPNVINLMGICHDPPAIVTEYCARGSLAEVRKRACHVVAAADSTVTQCNGCCPLQSLVPPWLASRCHHASVPWYPGKR